jgi:hypothetical protein
MGIRMLVACVRMHRWADGWVDAWLDDWVEG